MDKHHHLVAVIRGEKKIVACSTFDEEGGMSREVRRLVPRNINSELRETFAFTRSMN